LHSPKDGPRANLRNVETIDTVRTKFLKDNSKIILLITDFKMWGEE